MYILDELLNVESAGFCDKEFIDQIISLSTQSELILTGRVCPGYVLEKSNYASQIDEVKHPYNEGLTAREGIEY